MKLPLLLDVKSFKFQAHGVYVQKQTDGTLGNMDGFY